MRIEKKEGRAFIYTEGMNRVGSQEDSVNFTDNLAIVMWKTQLLFHNLWKTYFLSVVRHLSPLISRSLAPKFKKDCSEQQPSSWTLNVATFQLNLTQFNTMSYALETKQAVYFFNIEGDQALVSKLIRKGQKGQDQQARCSVAMARHWYQQLLTK